MPKKYIKLTPQQRAAAYAARSNPNKLLKDKKFKALIDEIFNTKNWSAFRSDRRGTGGKIPLQYITQFNEAIKAGPNSDEFKEILRISGRSAEEILELDAKRPAGKVDPKTRAIAAKESWPEWRKKTEAEKAATQAKARLKRAGNIAYSKAALGSKDFNFLEILNKKKAEINNFFKNDPKRLFNTTFGKNTKDLIDARFKDGKITFDRRANSYYQKLIDKGIYSEFDISPVRIKKKSLRYPINLNVAPSQFNSAFIEQVDRYFRKNNNPSALDEVSKFLKSKNLRLNIPEVGTIGAEADVAFVPETGKTPRIDKTLQILGYEGDGLEKIKEIYKNQPGSSFFRKGMDDIVKCADGCFIKVANKNPEKVLDTLKKEPQKLIRLFRGESFPQRNIKGFKSKAKFFKTTIPEIKKDTLSGQWFTPTQDHAGSYLSRPGRMKYVDVTPAELESFQRYKDRVNKRPVKYSVARQMGKPERAMHMVTDSFHHQLIPRYKLKQMEEAGRLKSKFDLNPFRKSYIGDAPLIPATRGVLEWNRDLGAFVDSANPGVAVGQNQLKAWAADNPMPVKAGTEDAFKPIKKSMLKTIGKSLAYVGAPLPTAVIDSYFIGKQIADDRPAENIAKDPLNWLGLATMSTLTDIAGVSKPGKINTALRLGMSPGLIRGASRFLGLPGLAISTALTAYDQYNKYQNEEGFIYNLFNDQKEVLL